MSSQPPDFLSYFNPILESLQKENPSVFSIIQKKLAFTLETTLQTAFLRNASLSKNAKIEQKIREDKIKSAFSMQKTLENKLVEVSRQLEELKESQTQKKKGLSAPHIDETKSYHEFLEKLESEKRKIIKKKQKVLKKISEENEKNAEITREKDLIEKEQRKKEIEQRIEKKKKKFKENFEQLTEKEAEYKDKVSGKRLFQKMQYNFEKYKAKEEKFKKKQLDKIKSFHKPISAQELQDFEVKFSNNLIEKERKREQKKAEFLAFVKDREDEIKQKFSSNILKKMEDMRRQELTKSQQKELLIVNKSLKHKEFFEEVKKKHKPKADTKKMLELEILKESLANKENYSEGNAEETPKKDSYEIGLEYLRSVKAKIAKNKEKNSKINISENFKERNDQNFENISEIPEKNEENNNFLGKNGDEISNFPIFNKEPSELQTQSMDVVKNSKPINYLKEVTEKYNLIKGPDYWKKIEKIQNLSPLEKLERLRQEAEDMEKKAKMKEQVLRVQRKKEFDAKLEEKNQDIDDLLLNSIQAKLKLLEN